MEKRPTAEVTVARGMTQLPAHEHIVRLTTAFCKAQQVGSRFLTAWVG